MRRITNFSAFVLSMVVGFVAATGAAWSQDGDMQQIALNEAMVTRYIAAQREVIARAKEIEQLGEDAAKLTDLLSEIARKHGFASFEELDVVAANVTLTLAGIDPDTGEYTDPKDSMRQELEEIKADSSISKDEKARLVSELEEAIESTPDLKFAENVAIVKKFAKQIEAVLE